MTQPALTLSALLALLTLPLSALAAGAHQHGQARLDVAIDGGTLAISLESPLDNLLGFEHAPRNDKQRAAVQKMEAGLQAGDLFKANADAGCQFKEVEIEHPFKAAAGTSPAKSHDAKAAHSDADVRWTYQCATPAALRSLDVQLFSRFSGLKSLKVQVAGPRGQTATTLRPGKALLNW